MQKGHVLAIRSMMSFYLRARLSLRNALLCLVFLLASSEESLACRRVFQEIQREWKSCAAKKRKSESGPSLWAQKQWLSEGASAREQWKYYGKLSSGGTRS